MVQFLENKNMIFHFMDVDYFFTIAPEKAYFFNFKNLQKMARPGVPPSFSYVIKHHI